MTDQTERRWKAVALPGAGGKRLRRRRLDRVAQPDAVGRQNGIDRSRDTKRAHQIEVHGERYMGAMAIIAFHLNGQAQRDGLADGEHNGASTTAALRTSPSRITWRGGTRPSPGPN